MAKKDGGDAIKDVSTTEILPSIQNMDDAVKWASQDMMNVAFVTEDKTTFLAEDEVYARKHASTFNLKLFKVK